MKKIIIKILFSGLVIFTACTRYDSDNPILTYYEVEGEGYVYDKITKKTVPFASVDVDNWYYLLYTQNNGIGSEEIYYFADSTGYYRIKFLKKFNNKKIKSYTIAAASGKVASWRSSVINFSSDFIKKQKKTIKLDTLWVQDF
ncbi:MAG: hypothetical protein LBV69_11020 [Bacteroidales bacterium]|jgi:hypothetical protein|nr:hypothetical protein [Bacteroidales bacterium]